LEHRQGPSCQAFSPCRMSSSQETRVMSLPRPLKNQQQHNLNLSEICPVEPDHLTGLIDPANHILTGIATPDHEGCTPFSLTAAIQSNSYQYCVHDQAQFNGILAVDEWTFTLNGPLGTLTFNGGPGTPTLDYIFTAEGAWTIELSITLNGATAVSDQTPIFV